AAEATWRRRALPGAGALEPVRRSAEITSGLHHLLARFRVGCLLVVLAAIAHSGGATRLELHVREHARLADDSAERAAVGRHRRETPVMEALRTSPGRNPFRDC